MHSPVGGYCPVGGGLVWEGFCSRKGKGQSEDLGGGRAEGGRGVLTHGMGEEGGTHPWGGGGRGLGSYPWEGAWVGEEGV